MGILGLIIVAKIEKYMALKVIPKLKSTEFKEQRSKIFILVVELILLILCFSIIGLQSYLGGNPAI